MQPSLRKATPDDEPFIRQLITESISASPAIALCPEAMRDRILEIQYSARRQSVRGNFPRGRSQLILSETDRQSVGWLYVADLPEELRLVEIIIAPSHRCKGLGSAVISELVSEAEKAGKPLRLSVDVANHRARRLYARLGFRPVASDEFRHYLEKGSG